MILEIFEKIKKALVKCKGRDRDPLGEFTLRFIITNTEDEDELDVLNGELIALDDGTLYKFLDYVEDSPTRYTLYFQDANIGDL